LFWVNPFHIPFKNLLKLQYTYKSEWLYTVPDLNANIGERYIYLQKSLGAPDNDGDSCHLGFSVVGKDFWAANIGCSYSRKGIRTAMSRWRDSEAGNIPGLPDDSSYTKEKMFKVAIEPLVYFKNFGNLRIGLAGCWVKNKNNAPSEKPLFSPALSAELTLHYSNFFFPLPK
jgi:hypothetical protein